MNSQFRQSTLYLLVVGIILIVIFVLWGEGELSLAHPALKHTITNELGAYPAPHQPDSEIVSMSAYPAPSTPSRSGNPWSTPTPNPFPTPNSPRQGVAPAGGMNTIATRHIFGTWGYHWGFSVPYPYPINVEHVPMIAWDTWQKWVPSISQIQTSAARTPHNYWLVFNECEHQFQCNTSPSIAADFYFNQLVPTIFDQSVPGGEIGADPNAALIVGGVNAHPCGIKWLSEFVEAYREITKQALGETLDPPRAGWHFHIYPEIYPDGWNFENNDCSGNWDAWDSAEGTAHAWRLADFNEWQSDAMNILNFVWKYGSPDDEIWITEMGCLPGFEGSDAYSAYCPNETFMAGYVSNITSWLNNEGRWVTRYAWYTDWDAVAPHDYTELYETPPPTPNPKLSDLGIYYSHVTPSSITEIPWPSIWLPVIHSKP